MTRQRLCRHALRAMILALGAIAIVVGTTSGDALAQHRASPVAIHSEVPATIEMPAPITGVRIVDNGQVDLWASGQKLVILAAPDTPAGTVAYVRVRMGTDEAFIHTRVTGDPAEVADVAYRPGENQASTTTAPQCHGAETAFVAQMPKTNGKEPKSTAWSVDLAPFYGQAVLGDNTAGADTDTISMTGLSALILAHRSPFHAYEFGATYARTDRARFEDVFYDGYMGGTLARDTSVLRSHLGVHFRSPTRITPFVRLGLGMQRRDLNNARLLFADGDILYGPADQHFYDFTTTAAIGLDFQPRASLALGLGISATSAVPLDGGPQFQAYEGLFHVSHRM